MSDEFTQKADMLIKEDEDGLFDALERDARRYSRAFEEEEEASLN